MVLIEKDEEDGLLGGPEKPDTDVLNPSASESDVDIEELEAVLEEYDDDK